MATKQAKSYSYNPNGLVEIAHRSLVVAMAEPNGLSDEAHKALYALTFYLFGEHGERVLRALQTTKNGPLLGKSYHWAEIRNYTVIIEKMQGEKSV